MCFRMASAVRGDSCELEGGVDALDGAHRIFHELTIADVDEPRRIELVARGHGALDRAREVLEDGGTEFASDRRRSRPRMSIATMLQYEPMICAGSRCVWMMHASGNMPTSTSSAQR